MGFSTEKSAKYSILVLELSPKGSPQKGELLAHCMACPPNWPACFTLETLLERKCFAPCGCALKLNHPLWHVGKRCESSNASPRKLWFEQLLIRALLPPKTCKIFPQRRSPAAFCCREKEAQGGERTSEFFCRGWQEIPTHEHSCLSAASKGPNA